MLNILRKTFWKTLYTIQNNRMSSKCAAMMVDLFFVPVVQRVLPGFAADTGCLDTLRLDRMQKTLNKSFAEINGFLLPPVWKGSVTLFCLRFKNLRAHAVTLNIETLFLNVNLDPRTHPVAATTHDRLASFCKIPEARGQDRFHRLKQCLDVVQSALPWGRLPLGSTHDNATAQRLEIALQLGVTLTFNPAHLKSKAMDPVVTRASPGPMMSEAQPSLRLMHNAQALEMRQETLESTFEIDPYTLDWMQDLCEAPFDAHVTVFTDGSSKAGEDSGAAACWYTANCEEPILVIRARLRPDPTNYFPECVACLLALRFAPTTGNSR